MSIKRIPIAIGIKPDQVTTFTNKTISGSNNTLTNIGNSSLVNKSITINGVPVELGSSVSLASYSPDYSGNPGQPTAISYTQGHLNIEGDVVSGDVDYVTFTVGSSAISSLYLTHYNGTDGIAFFAIQQGSSWTAGQNTNQMVAYSHFGPGASSGYRVNDNILAGQNVTLAANTTYTMWIQQTGINLTKYTFSTNPSYTGSWALVDTNTTYSIKASTVTNGASLDLDAGGTGTGTDSVNFVGGGNVSVTRLNDSTIRITDAGLLGGVALTADNTATLTNKTISGNQNTLSAIPNSALVNNSITINGQTVALGGSVTVAGGGGGGGEVTLNTNQTLTNKTISGSNNTLTNIGNSSLVNSSITINGTTVALGGSLTVAGLGNVTTDGVQDLSNKSLASPIVQNPKIFDGIRLGAGNGVKGTAGQVITSTGTDAVWANPNRTTEAALVFGSGLSGSGGSTSFDGSNGFTVSVDTSVVATLSAAQTLTNKTYFNPIFNGTITINGSVGAAGQVLTSTGSGIQWAAGGSGGSGSFNGPGSATDNAIVRFDGTTGALAQNSLVTISDTGVITAPSVSSIIPFNFANSLAFPDATANAGAIAVSQADTTAFVAAGGNWIQLAKSSEAAVSTRQALQTTTASLASNATAYPNLTGFKSYLLLKIQTDKAAWVRVYTSSTARTNDAARSIDTDPTPGSGVIAEVITTGASTQVLTPATIGFNDDSPVASTIYLSVTNRSGSSGTITVTLTALKLEA
jgi:hypothetical protein